MLNKTSMKFAHVKPGDTDFKGEGLRDFFLYRDLGVAEATAGKVLEELTARGLHFLTRLRILEHPEVVAAYVRDPVHHIHADHSLRHA